MKHLKTFLTHFAATLVVGILALIGGFVLANGPAARAAMEKAGILAAPVIPATFNYQGYLREADGTPTNGTKTITTKIYAAAAGGTAKHTQVFSNVNVRDGLFNVVIGDGVPLGSTFDTAPLFIGITLDNGSELIPRERIHGVPWAIYATNAQNATNATNAANAQNAANATNATTAVNATTAANAANAAVADKIKASGITKTYHTIDRRNMDGGRIRIAGDYESTTEACFLTGAFSSSWERNSCLIEETDGDNNTYLITQPDAYCTAICLQWGP